MKDKPDSGFNLFPTSQLELIKLAKEQGLNPDTLFTGLIIGLEAGIVDLLEQTNKVVREWLNERDAND